MGGVYMAFQGRSGQVTDPDDASTNEEPLLSGRGRDFLDGKIGAVEYLERARRLAAEDAQRDVINDISRQQVVPRRTIRGVLIFASGAYAILGAATLLSGGGFGAGVAAITTAIALPAAVTVIQFLLRHKD